jgi:SAM-dependent methyltransferase
VRRRPDPFGGLSGALYAGYIESERAARVGGRLLWGGDPRPMYASMSVVGEAASGSVILDVPCGAGVAFRALSPARDVRYTAVDLSDQMLERARRTAARRGLAQIDFVQADVDTLPVGDESVDLLLSYNGLHCFPDPEAALAEMARCLRPGAQIVGSALVRGAGRRQDALIAWGSRGGGFGPGGTASDLERWLASAGLDEVVVTRSGAIALFRARG